MSRMDRPLVSVVVPCLNRAHYLAPTLDSILEQDYPNVECIVIDGGSSDGTIDILKRYGDRISWISEPDEGHADAINKGWRMSRGDILAWLNADDLYVVPDAITNAAAFLDAHDDVDVVYGSYSTIHPDNSIVSGVIQPRQWDLYRAVVECDNIIPQPASFIRRPILERIGWLDTGLLAVDHDLWIRISLEGTIRHLPVNLAYARLGEGHSLSEKIAYSLVQMIHNLYERKDLPGFLQGKRRKQRALSNAWLRGATFLWRGNASIQSIVKLYVKSIREDVSHAPYIVFHLFKHLVLAPIPFRIQTRCRLLLMR